MKNNYNLGKYQYSSGTIKLASALFVAGLGYALFTGKSPLSVLGFALLGSIAGFSIGALITPPERIQE